jgi:hypothetical protein
MYRENGEPNYPDKTMAVNREAGAALLAKSSFGSPAVTDQRAWFAGRVVGQDVLDDIREATTA